MEQVNEDSSAYGDDVVVWLDSQIAALRDRDVGRIDFDRLIEELEGLVRNHRRELRSRLQVIIMHLLKWQFQPQLRSSSWATTLSTQRYALDLLLEDCPSLRRLLASCAREEYVRAVRWALRETRLPRSVFPEALPYTVAELLDPDFVP